MVGVFHERQILVRGVEFLRVPSAGGFLGGHPALEKDAEGLVFAVSSAAASRRGGAGLEVAAAIASICGTLVSGQIYAL